MALHNEILSPRHNKFLTKLFSMKGPAPAPQLATDIQVGHPIFHGVENRFLESWNRFGFFFIDAPGVGLNSNIILAMPSGSRVIAVVEKIVAYTTVAGQIEIQFGQGAPAAGAITGRATDGRISTGFGGSSLVPAFQHTNALQIGTTIVRYATFALTPVEVIQHEDHEIVISPGDRINIEDNTNNDNFSCSVWWRERPLEESELK